jgi:hypothetical protein
MGTFMQRCGRHTEYWLENLKGRAHLEDLGINRRIILKSSSSTSRSGPFDPFRSVRR